MVEHIRITDLAQPQINEMLAEGIAWMEDNPVDLSVDGHHGLRLLLGRLDLSALRKENTELLEKTWVRMSSWVTSARCGSEARGQPGGSVAPKPLYCL